ncbi:PREDICTED: igLON family member 5-like isoform X4 [Branchiostoma belcheri]|uniref:IgLON family member 5-like isoform X4 n=1 Tax=Branchiostoma belcheri TaxID=7741 RepID=A0A6P4ZYK8_BRABE|nr:PREDICTED: igLON family member 5-like isoform X4 [Branchiostoma belcheri]
MEVGLRFLAVVVLCTAALGQNKDPSFDPYLSSAPQVGATQGDSVRLRCHIRNRNREYLIWQKGKLSIFVNDQEVIRNDRYSLFTQQLGDTSYQYDLVIANVSIEDDEDTYRCIVYTKTPRTLSIELLVVVPTTIMYASPSQAVEKGEDVELFCNATGRPEPEIRWVRTRDGATFEENPLVIRSVTENDAGGYQCYASQQVANARHSDIRTAEVTVYYRPVINLLLLAMPSELLEGSLATMTCIATANPRPMFYWYRDGTELRDGENRLIISITPGNTESILTIQNVRARDYGNYTCRVVNNRGATKASVYIGTPPTLVPTNGSRHWQNYSTPIETFTTGHKEECPPKYDGFCLHGGICFYVDQLGVGCTCPIMYEGERCQYGSTAAQAAAKQRNIAYGIVAGVLALVLIVLLVWFCRKRKWQGTYVVENTKVNGHVEDVEMEDAISEEPEDLHGSRDDVFIDVNHIKNLPDMQDTTV